MTENQVARARAPVRIDLAGGWTDVPPYSAEHGGAVVNAAISRYAYATLRPLPPGHYQLESADYDAYFEAQHVRALEYDGNLDLVKAAIRRRGLETGAYIITRSEAPPGSGTGSSAAMGVALVGLLDYIAGCQMSLAEIAEMAHLLEVEELGIGGGRQDQYAAAFGGINYMRFHDGNVEVQPLELSEDFLRELEKHLLLIYTGKSRLSGDIIDRVMGAYKSKDERVTQALNNLCTAAEEMREALLAEDLRRVGEVMNFNWENQQRLYEEMCTHKIRVLVEAMEQEAGLLGVKAAGAGGGGCIIALAKPDREHLAVRAAENLGGQLIDFKLDFTGLRRWTAARL
ncbi:MAG: GHMP kinase [Armatimonadetes bacterium]|nr:GHMP kinase [Armatimonadota bacterium]